jgi:hypothetical protein
VRFVGPDVGKLACGYEAIGHLAEPQDIVAAAKQLVQVIGAPSSNTSGAQARPAVRAASAPRRRPSPARKPARRPARRR